MAKFIKELLDKAKEASVAKKIDLVWKAKGLSKQTMETMYSIYFWSIDAFIKGEPSFWEEQGFRLYVVPGIDTDFNRGSQVRCKEILAYLKLNKKVGVEDRVWLERELKPYFEQSMKKQINKTIDALQAVDEGKIKEFMKQVKKQKKGLYK